MIPHVSRLLELWRIAAHYRLDTLFPAEELPEKARHILSLIRMHPAAWSSRERKNPLNWHWKKWDRWQSSWVSCFRPVVT